MYDVAPTRDICPHIAALIRGICRLAVGNTSGRDQSKMTNGWQRRRNQPTRWRRRPASETDIVVFC